MIAMSVFTVSFSKIDSLIADFYLMKRLLWVSLGLACARPARLVRLA
jgi:hypothetical protein